MEVTDKNFYGLIPRIEESIDRAAFLAIDCELSGLKVSDEKDNFFETVEERYLSVRDSVSKFLVLQFGLCPFFYNSETDEFTHEAYNFYTYPRQISKSSPNIRFLCESSSLDFLASTGFDFNKLIYEGIPYLTYTNEEKMKEDIDKRNAYKTGDDNSSFVPVPEHMKHFVQTTKQKILKFNKSGTKELKIDNLTPFQRKLIFQNIKPLYSSELYFETIVVNDPDEIETKSTSSSEYMQEDTETTPIRMDTSSPTQQGGSINRTQASRTDSKSRVLRIVKLGKTEQNAIEEEKKRRDVAAISQNIGFSKIIRKMSQSGKIIVGHNMLLDVSHTINQFVDDLPDNLADYKEMVQDTFSNLIDTKYMSSALPFRELVSSTVLYDLVKRIQETPFGLPKIEIEPRQLNAEGYSLTDRKKHEAGFDAFTTGCCFIAMTQYLGSLQVPPKPRTLPCSPVVMPFLNKLYIMRMSDVSYLNISGTDLTPSRSHVFYVTCPKDATQKNIQQIFSPFGSVQIWWRNSVSLFVALVDKDQSSLVMDNIECKAGYRVLSFAAYQKMMQDEKKRPLLSESPERAGEIFKKLVCGDKSPPSGGEHKKKRPKTEVGKVKIKQVFAEPTSWN